ncbi:MAG TPA: hypothetical protein ENJ35_02800 [Gammaproteobacteria bacterium]|nr:hypothetical protein [Gammaproteobacteria bacterium]
MAETVTKTYRSEEALKNVKDDLVSTGFEQEHIFLDKENKQVKVMIPDVIEPEVLEILNRHDPID